ncbi:putative reductive dehalogenase (rdhA) [marine sediment metagenome]|uniref:Putative reductive dehalogenase (RdhA) n=1 Tax=marine sediment metagenome TaxID=412755 RepID=X1KF95_9ZZZZ
MLGEFIRELGYEAIQSGNDTGLSIPLAIDAGFGALGRNGLLVTPEYGSRVQICKVFTDLPLIPDKPNIEFIEELSSFCRGCYKCADACEVKAISFNSKPNFKVRSFSNNPGVKKYYIDPEKCFEFWIENHSDCSNCITACPFSKVNYPLAPKEFWKNK